MAERLISGYGEAIDEEEKVKKEKRVEESIWGRVKFSIVNALRNMKNMLCPRREQHHTE